MPEIERELEIRGPSIRLGQLLKFAGLAGSGVDAKLMLAAGGVEVNGQPETRRGRQLHPGDSVRVGTDGLRIVSSRSPG